MRSFKTITFHAPLVDVRLQPAPASAEAEQARLAGETAAYERGRRDGERALSEQLMQQRAELLELHQGVLQSLNNLIPQVRHDTEKALVDLALEAARKIVAGMPIQSRLVEAVVREAVGQAEDSAEINIHLNPDDLALLRKHQSPILQGLPDAGPMRFTASTEVSRGGCMIQTRFGVLDARRETKMEQLRQSLAA